jgi:hypothetical protein
MPRGPRSATGHAGLWPMSEHAYSSQSPTAPFHGLSGCAPTLLRRRRAHHFPALRPRACPQRKASGPYRLYVARINTPFKVGRPEHLHPTIPNRRLPTVTARKTLEPRCEIGLGPVCREVSVKPRPTCAERCYISKVQGYCLPDVRPSPTRSRRALEDGLLQGVYLCGAELRG